MSGGYLMPGDLDDALVAMIRFAEKTVTNWLGDGPNALTIEDIDWDASADTQYGVAGTTASHAIGFICGVAAALDVTPLTLLDSYDAKPAKRRQRIRKVKS